MRARSGGRRLFALPCGFDARRPGGRTSARRLRHRIGGGLRCVGRWAPKHMRERRLSGGFSRRVWAFSAHTSRAPRTVCSIWRPGHIELFRRRLSHPTMLVDGNA